MVRLIAPMMSGEARGKFGNIIVFKKRLGTNVACRYFVPRNPKTPGQIKSRNRTSSALTRWQAAAQSTIDAWNAYAKQFQNKGYNRYCSGFMIYMRDNAEAEPGTPFLPPS